MNKRIDIDGLFWPMVQVLLIVLKLTGVVDWSWWVILAPLWLTVASAVAVFIFLLIVIARRCR